MSADAPDGAHLRQGDHMAQGEIDDYPDDERERDYPEGAEEFDEEDERVKVVVSAGTAFKAGFFGALGVGVLGALVWLIALAVGVVSAP